jgi:Anti-sigma-K factor rskA
MRRRFVLLLVASAATAAAVAYYIGRRSRDVLRGRDDWQSFTEAAGTTVRERGASRAAEAPAEKMGTTEAPPMVVATMEATSELDGFEHNGAGSGPALVEPEPAHAGTEAALGAIQLEPMEFPRKRRISGITLAVLGALAGAGAIALGAWGIASSIGGGDGSKAQSPTAVENVQEVVSLIAKPTTATIPLSGSQRRIILVVGAKGYGVLVLNNVTAPPTGKTYEAWVIKPNVKAPEPAGLFTGGTGVVKLTKPVPAGAVVAITVEPAGGSAAPTQQPKLVATRT